MSQTQKEKKYCHGEIKMNKIIAIIIAISICLSTSSISYSYDTLSTASVVLAGGIIKAQNSDVVKKYKRKDCPVCKGAGWYWSGDGIKKVDCGYCEPELKQNQSNVIVHPPVTLKQQCADGVCKPITKVK